MTSHRGAAAEGATGGQIGLAALLLGIAGLLPLLPVVGSVAALICGYAGDRRDPRARAGILLGWLGLFGVAAALVVYCLVLGYPFPIHRYDRGR